MPIEMRGISTVDIVKWSVFHSADETIGHFVRG